MASEVIGKARCAECDSVQEVKHDGRKHFIPCTDCGTMMQYQSKLAQAKVEARMVEVDEPDEALPLHATKDKPVKPGFFDSYASVYA